MKYTKPHILATVNAGAAIQTGADGGKKFLITHPDNDPMVAHRSTTGAYEADE